MDREQKIRHLIKRRRDVHRCGVRLYRLYVHAAAGSDVYGRLLECEYMFRALTAELRAITRV